MADHPKDRHRDPHQSVEAQLDDPAAGAGQSPLDQAMREGARRHRWLFLIEGLVFVGLGIAAIVWPQVATVTVTVFVGWLFVIGGIVQLITTAASRSAPGYGWTLAAAVLAILLGILLLWDPLAGVLTLTAVLTGYFLAVGVVRIVAALRNRDMPNWGLLLVSGIVSLLLGGLIVFGLPLTATWVLGLVAGIELLFAGFAILALVWRTRAA